MLACVLAHETAYQLMYPGPGAYRAAMTVLGHDGYWLGLTVAATVAAVTLVVVAAAQLRRLRREAGSTPALAADEAPGIRAYLRLVVGTWLTLATMAAVIYTAQENLEAIAAGLSFRGMDVILGHGLLPLLVVLAATLLMSLAVALVRWRRRVLLGRLADAARPWAGRAPRGWRIGGPVVLLGWAAPGSWGSRAPPCCVARIAL